MLECIWMNGFWKNRDELAASAGIAAAQTGRRDEEILEKLVAAEGYSVVGKFNGYFAFSMYDPETDTWFGARDRFGPRGFFYAQDENGGLITGRTIEEILATGKIKKEFNDKLLETFLGFSYIPGEETLFRGIRKLPAAHMIICRDGKITVEPYWQPRFEPDKSVSEDEWVQRIRKCLDRSFAPFEKGRSLFLSSGIDSTFLAARLKPKVTYTAKFCVPEFDETVPDSVSDARYNNELCEIGPEQFLDAVPNAIRLLEHPSGDASMIALYLLTIRCGQDTNEIYSGECIDELFFGYFAPRRYVSAEPGQPEKDGYTGCTHIMRDEQKQKLLRKFYGEKTDQSFMEYAYQLTADASAVDQAAMCDIISYLGGSIMPAIERQGGDAGVEIRLPYADNELFDIALKIPHELKLKDDLTKYIFRRAVEHELGHEKAFRKKRGFPVPVRVWMKEDSFRGRIREAFESREADQFFRTDYLKELLDDQENIDRNWRQIWCIYTFIIWYRMFFGES